MTYTEAIEIIRANYETTEALGLAIEALDLHTEKKPLDVRVGPIINITFSPEYGQVIEQTQGQIGRCPKCGCEINVIGNERMCMACSQLIDWRQ